MQDAYHGVLDGHEGHTPKSCCPLRCTLYISRKSEKNLMQILHFCVPALLLQFQARSAAYYVQILQNREYLQYGLSNGKHTKIIKVTSTSSYV